MFNLIYLPNVNNLEGPIWDEDRKCIWCVGIEEGLVFCISEEGSLVREYNMGSQVGCIFLKKNSFIAATYHGLFEVDIKKGSKNFLIQLNKNSSLRYNDGKWDPRGRILVGTTGYNRLAEGENCLYSWDGQNKKVIIEKTTISNGIAFSNDNNYMYFVDSPTKMIDKYKYDLETGNVKFDEHIISITGQGIPDGISMDEKNNLWVAEWNGGKVSKWNSLTGEKLEEIQLPVLNVSSCCIGGNKKDTLYVTTAKHDDGSENEAMSGGLFKIRIGKN